MKNKTTTRFKTKSAPTPSYVGSHTVNAEQQTRVAQSATNIDILKRISRLKKKYLENKSLNKQPN